MPHLEGPATKIYNSVLGGVSERRRRGKRDWQQLLAQVPIFKKKIRFLIEIKRKKIKIIF